MEIPSDFASKWGFSDVILIAENSEGRELHACKASLSIYSPFFERMFFSNFKEANEPVVNVSCDYETLLEILRLIHHNNHDLYKEIPCYETPKLQELYKAADYLDVPAVRKMVERQLLDNVSVETAIAALGLGLHDIVMMILERLGEDCVKNFLAIDNSDAFFSKRDVLAIYKKLSGSDLPLNSETLTFFSLDPLTEDSKIDSIQKSKLNNVEIRTKNSDGKLLYSNIVTLATVSSHFYNMFYGVETENKSNENAEDIIPDLDVDYAVMKNILLHAHHCARHSDFREFSMGTLKKLYLMYLTAAEDKLDIPMIRWLCEDYLEVHKGIKSADVACKLGLHKLKSTILGQLQLDELQKWVGMGNEDTNYTTTRGNGNVTFAVFKEMYILMTPGKKEQILSPNDVRFMVEKFLAEFNKKS